MKKLLGLLTAAVLLFGSYADAANTATEIGTMPTTINGKNYTVSMVLVTYDTPSGDLTVKTAATSAHSVCSFMTFMSEGTAMTMTFKPKTGQSLPLELAANQGIWDKAPGIGPCTVPGNDFVINSTSAFSVLWYLVQDTRFNF